MSADTLLLHDDILPESFIGTYFDGESSAAQPVSVVLMGAHVAFFGEGWTRREAAHRIRMSEPLQRAPVRLRLPKGASCELPTSPLLLGRLRQSGLKPPLISVWQGDLRLVVLTLAFLAAMIAVFYAYVLPALAGFGAAAMPQKLKNKLGDAALASLDARWFAPTRLSAAQQGTLQMRFDRINADAGDVADLEFRAVRNGQDGKPLTGPNAFALPGGTVVLTDSLFIALNGNLDALSGVLAHEVGHVMRDDPTQGMIRTSALAALATALYGDFSSLAAAAPVVLGEMRYGRQAEFEADQFAKRVMCRHRWSSAALASFFAKPPAGMGDEGHGLPDFLSSHPANAQRAALMFETCPAAP